MVKDTHLSLTLSVNHSELREIIIRCYEKKKPLLIWGLPGIGKSAEVKASGQVLAKRYNLEYIDTKTPNLHSDKFCVVDTRLAQRDPSDLLGMPDTFVLVRIDDTVKEIPLKVFRELIERNGVSNIEIISYITKWSAPNWLPIEGKGIIFLDEVLQAPPLIRSAAAELIYDRRLGDWVEPEGYIVIGATNRLKEAPIFDISPFLANRFLHVELNCPSVEEWSEWALEKGIDGRIIAYLMAHQSAIYQYSPTVRQRAYPTPRSWEYTSDLIKEITDLNLIELYSSAAVGPHIAGEFRAFLRLTEKLPPIRTYIDEPKKTIIPEEHDLLYSLCASLGEYFRGNKNEKVLKSIVVTLDLLNLSALPSSL